MVLPCIILHLIFFRCIIFLRNAKFLPMITPFPLITSPPPPNKIKAHQKGSWTSTFTFLCTCLQRVEKQEKEDEQLCVKTKGGRSQQQKKKPSKPAKKADDKPKAQKKPAVAKTQEKEKKKADSKSKDVATKKADKSDDSSEFDEGDAAAPVLSLAQRLAQRQKLPSSSSSSAGSGAESVGSSASRSKKQTTLEMFSTKKKAADKAKKVVESDDDFIMQFSDEEDVPPPVKRVAKSVAAKVCAECYIRAWLPQARKWSGEKILPRQGKVWKFYFESGKIDILKKSQGN